MSILEEATISVVLPMMGVFNNLVVYDQNMKQNSLNSIVPDLATSWEFSEDGTQLTFITDQQFYENYACGSERNYTGYCNRELQKLFDRQSIEADQQRRKALVWEIDKRLQEDVARPIIYHNQGGTCWRPRVKGLTLMVNSIFNGNRFEDIRLDE
jgi:ABC-type transport system substrate-binding protein